MNNPNRITHQPVARRRWSITVVWIVTAAAAAVAAVGPATAPPTSTKSTTGTLPSPVTMPITTATSPASPATTTSTVIPPTPRPTEPVAPPPPPGPGPGPGPAPTTQSIPQASPGSVLTPPPPQPEVIDGEVKYWIAYLKGQQLKDALQQGNAGGDDYNVLRGLLDGLQGRPPAYAKEDIEERVARMMSMAAAKRAENLYAGDPNFRKQADENMQKSRAAIEQFSQLDGTETRSDGVLVRVLDVGSGRVVGNAKTITMKVRVELSDGSLVKGTDPNQSTTVSTADLLSPLAENLRGMKVGGHWRVLLPPDRAYGLAGKPPAVGPNQALLYDIELTGAQ